MKKLTRVRLESFLKPHSSNAYTLDLGCANSPYSKWFTNRVGSDIAAGDGVDVVADAHNLPFADEEFEQILATEVLEHLHTPQKAIAEMIRVLKPGGKLILTTRFVFPIHDAPHDYYRYTKYGLQHLFKDWEIVSLEEEVTTMDTFRVLLQRVAVQADLRGGKLTKGILYGLGLILGSLAYLIKGEYGRPVTNTKAERIQEQAILSSGYYLVCKKK